jgi:hypothetical protein
MRFIKDDHLLTTCVLFYDGMNSCMIEERCAYSSELFRAYQEYLIEYNLGADIRAQYTIGDYNVSLCDFVL